MSSTFIFLVIALIVIGALTGEDFVFTLIYLLVGVYMVGRFWSTRAITSVSLSRKYTHRAFPKEEIPVEITLVNRSVLPVVWLRVQDLLPIELSLTKSYQQVISLGPREKMLLNYVLSPLKRGYYPVGPFKISTGDLLGMALDERIEKEPEHLTVYPRVVPLAELGLPSRSPLGTLKHTQPVYEDPSRSAGKRDYIYGDSLRRIDWKASAAVGQLQVKQFEPSIALETVIFLSLNNEDFHFRRRIDATELAIVVAASLSNWVISNKQSAGLITNGIDPLNRGESALPVLPRKGRAQLMRMLETMARLKAGEVISITEMICQYRNRLSWGSTMVVITGKADEELFDEFFQAQRSGLDIVLILCGESGNIQAIQRRAKRHGIRVYFLWSEQDLELWHK